MRYRVELLCSILIFTSFTNASVRAKSANFRTSDGVSLHSFDAGTGTAIMTMQEEQYIQHIKEESLKTPTNTAAVEMFNVLSRGDFTAILAKIDKPVLYICEPRLESQGKVLRTSLPNARVEIFQNAGHALFVDDATHFNSVVGEFVDSLAAGSRKPGSYDQ